MMSERWAGRKLKHWVTFCSSFSPSFLSVQRNSTSRLCRNIKIFMGEGSIFGHKVNFLVQTLSESVEISMDSIIWKLDEKLWLCTKNATCWHNQKYVYIIAMTSNTTTNYCCAPKMPLVDILEKYDFFYWNSHSNDIDFNVSVFFFKYNLTFLYSLGVTFKDGQWSFFSVLSKFV